MSLLDKLKFWKKDEEPELDLGKYPALEAAPGAAHPELTPPADISTPPAHLEEIGPGPIPPPGMQRPAPAAFAQPAQAIPAPAPQGDMQMVNAKLDTLKILLENINARLDRMERPEEEKPIPLSVRRWR